MKIDVLGIALRRANARPMTGSAKQSIEPRRHCERSEAIHKAPKKKEWTASRSLSSGAHSRDPLAGDDG